MGYIQDLDNKIKDYMQGEYAVEAVSTIPSVEQVAFGNKAKRIKLCALCIDLRKSTELLAVKSKQTCGKIHKAFLTIASELITKNGGHIRSFNGDGILAFFYADKPENLDSAVAAAFKLKWALNTKFAHHFKDYATLDFGIGMDVSDVYIVRAGLPKNDNNNDLVFLGMCVNFSTRLASKAKGPNHIEISKGLYDQLTSKMKMGVSVGKSVNMWTPSSCKWKEQDHPTCYTSWHIGVDG